MEYIACFAISVLLAYFANKTQRKLLFWVLSVLSILVTVFLAGLRDYSIGIDTIHYMTKGRYWYGAIHRETLWEYMEYYISLDLGEPLFALLIGVIAYTCGNYSVFLFVSHLAIISCVYIGAYRFRKTVNPAFVLLLFYLLFFNHSLNIVRQYIAEAIIFAALADIPQKKYIRYSLFVVLATLFHNSALLGFGALFVHIYLNWDWRHSLVRIKTFFRKRKGLEEQAGPATAKVQEERASAISIKNQRFRLLPAFDIRSGLFRRQIVLFTGLIFLVLLVNPLCRLVINMGLLNEKYLFFLDTNRVQPTILISLFLLVEIATLIVFYRKYEKQIPLFSLFFTCSISYLILQQVSFFLVYGKRVAAYFSLMNLITIAMIPKAFENKKYRKLAYLAVMGVTLFYWFYCYALRNASQTYPYQFIFQ